MLRACLLLCFVAGALSAAFSSEDEGFLPSGPLAVNKMLEEFYFPNSPLRPEELELVKVEYKMADADGIAVKFRMTFQVVGQDEQCKVQVFEQKLWGKTAHYLQYDLCKRFADRSDNVAVPYGGGWGEADVTDVKVTALLEEFYFPSSLLRAEQLELVRVERQVVAGMNYRYHFNVVGTNAQCQVLIFEQSWTKTRQVLLDTCLTVAGSLGDDVAVPFTGGWGPSDVNDPALAVILEEFYFPGSVVGAEQLQMVRAEHQVVDGFNYRMFFNVVGTNAECVVEIYQHWAGHMQVKKDTCFLMIGNVGPRSLKAVPFVMGGAWQETDANDLEATSLLQEVYFPQSVGEEYLTLLKVQSQVVSGVNYKYTFQIGKHGVTCYAIVYSQPWTNTKRVTVDTCLM